MDIRCLAPGPDRAQLAGMAQIARSARKSVWQRLLVWVLCAQFAFPFQCLAEDGQSDTSNASDVAAPQSANELRAEQSLAELQKQILESGEASSRLALTAVQRNVGFLLHQDLIDTQTGKIWDLTDVNLSRPRVSVGAGLVARSLIVDRTPNGVVLGIEGNRYRHRINFNPGVNLQDFDWDSELVELLLTDGSRHAIEISSLGPTSENMAQGLLYSAPVPVFYLGHPQSIGARDSKPITGIRIIQRRVDPVDRSRKAQEARLDRNPSTRERGLISANPKLIDRVVENLELVRPIPLAPELEEQLQRSSADGIARLNAGDTALIHFDGKNETLVGIDSRISEAGMIGLQLGALSGLWYVASPESQQATKEVFELRNSAKGAIASITDDDSATQEFFQSGLQSAMAQIPASALNATNAYAQKISARIGELKKLGTPDALRDSFTLSQQLDDYEYYSEYLADLRTASRTNEAKSRWNPTRYPEGRRWTKWLGGIGSNIADFDLPQRMRQAATVLKKPLLAGVAAAGIAAGAAGVDYMATHGQNVGLAVDTLAATWNHTIDYTVPVLRDLKYVQNMAMHSITSRTGLLLSVFLIAALARPFAQHSINKLIASTGIKYFFSYSVVPPQRLLAKLTFRPELIDAMKRGHLPLELLHPLGSLSPQWGSRLESASRRMSEKDRLRSLATILSLGAIAEREGSSVATLLSKGGAEGANAAGIENGTQNGTQNLTLALMDILAYSGEGKLFRELHADPATFFESLALGRKYAQSKRLSTPNPQSLKALMRASVSRRLLSQVGNFQEARFLALNNPQPPQDFADYIARGYLVDGIFTLMVSSFSGSYADLAKPENLAFQPGSSLLWTHKYVWINDWEQIFLHLGASASVDFLSAGLESREAFSFLKPATAYDTERITGSRGFERDSASALGLLFNLRRNNYAVGFGERSWNQCVRLLQGFLIIGMGLRLFEGVLDGQPASSILSAHAFEHALVGQLYFVFVAPFVYRWFWAVAITTTRTLQKQIAALGAGYAEHFTELSVALERKDFATAQREAEILAGLYSRGQTAVPDKILQSLKPLAGEDIGVWANRVLEACRSTPPVPETTNERTNKSIIFVGSIITTILAGYLMVDSFQDRPFRGFDVPEGSLGFDLTDWWAWNGMSRADSIPALMFKSLANIWAVWGAGHLFNLVVDAAKMARASNSEAAVDRWKEYKKSEAAARSMPILNLSSPRPPLLTPFDDSSCGKLLETR